MQLCGLNVDAPVVVGVSGGADSLCLLDSLSRLGFTLIAAHFDHQLRPESAQDAETVRAIAGGLGQPFRLGRADVGAYARQEHLSLEEAARLLRYQFLFSQARDCAAQAVAVGHTADDQVETVLMHLLRGTGLSGLKGMRYRSLAPAWDAHIPLVRPLLDFWHTETLEYSQERNLNPIFDSSNLDPVFFRNRLRSELIPFLEQYNPQARSAIWRTAQILAGDAEVVEAAVQAAWPGCLVKAGPGMVVLSLPGVRALLPGLQRGVLRQAIAQLLPGLRDVDFAAVERTLAFTRRSAPEGKVDLVAGLRLWIEGENVIIAGPQPPPADEDWPQLAPGAYPLAIPGRLELPGGWLLQSAWAEWTEPAAWAASENSRWEAWLDAAGIAGALVVRATHPGDRFQPLGMEGHSLKLSDFWINQKLPRRARALWPLVTYNDMILWVPGYRPAHAWRVTGATRTALHLWLERPGK